MITSIMAGFAFGYCVMDIIMNVYNKNKENELLMTTVEVKK